MAANDNWQEMAQLNGNSLISEERDHLVPLVYLARNGRSPSSYDDMSVPCPAYETIVAPEDQKPIHVQFRSRSQSLPHLGETKVRRKSSSSRIRFLSGRMSDATLVRMRNISTRTFSVVAPTDENQQRGNWSNPIEFFLSCLGYAVGLGNVWRFPYLCYASGGGAFLIPYLLMLFGCGLPLMFMELSLGQYSSQGPLTVWKIAPLFKGLGIGMVLCSCMVAVYYNMITGWALYYLFVSIREVLPWTCCQGHWATENCVSFMAESDFCRLVTKLPAIGLPNSDNVSAIHKNISANLLKFWENGSDAKFAADEYFHNNVLGMSGGLHDLGHIQWSLVMSLFFAWSIVFVVLMKGIKSFGKAVYFTSLFPYLILTILLVRAAMEEGALDGIKFYLTPKWEKLQEAKVWGDAASQIFYSTGVCFGGAITLASYNRFKNNVYRDALFVAFGNSLTSIFSGFVVFSILGFMAHSQNTTVDKVVTGGPGLTFVAYPQAITILPISPLWSSLFFLMLVTLALSTMFPTTENIATAIIDQFPKLLREYKFFVMLVVCMLMFLFGLPLTTKGGMYVLQMMDAYGVSYVLLVLGFIEVTVVAWRYKAGRLLKNIKTMIGFQPSIIWKYVWVAITPSLLIFSVAFTVVKFEPLEYGDYKFPFWSHYIGFCLTSICLAPIPIYAIYKLASFLIKQQEPASLESVMNALRVLTTPDQDWGPALPQYRFADTEPGDDDVFGGV